MRSQAERLGGYTGRGAGPPPRQISSEGIIFSDKVRSLADLVNDEGLAAEEALAQGGVPGYCADRYFRAASGGQYCAKFDQRGQK